MKAIFAGSFDPFTTGHLDIASRALCIFDRLVIAIGHNVAKPGMWPVAIRLEAIRSVFRDEPRVEVTAYEGLTVDFARSENCEVIVRGARDASDFGFEQRLADTNRTLAGIETVILTTRPELAFVSSSMVRELIANGADASGFIAWPAAFNTLNPSE